MTQGEKERAPAAEVRCTEEEGNEPGSQEHSAFVESDKKKEAVHKPESNKRIPKKPVLLQSSPPWCRLI